MGVPVSDPYHSDKPSPDWLLRPEGEVHEYVVDEVRDVTREGKIFFESGGGADTGWRQAFPLTYDIPLNYPDPVHTAEDE
jgi:hypothetical protein